MAHYPWRMSARASLSSRSSPSLLVALLLPLLSFPAFAQPSNKRLSPPQFTSPFTAFAQLSNKRLCPLPYCLFRPSPNTLINVSLSEAVRRASSTLSFPAFAQLSNNCLSLLHARERACSTILKVVAFASRSLISPFTVFSGLRPTQ